MTPPRIPDLTHRGHVIYSLLETPWSLNQLMYKGLSALPIDEATDLLKEGNLPHPSKGRIKLAVMFFENFEADLVAGKSRQTVKGQQQRLRAFYAWADAYNQEMTKETVEKVFLNWCDWTLEQSRTTKLKHPFDRVIGVSRLIDKIFDRSIKILTLSRIKNVKRTKSWGRASDKIDFESLFKFGGALLDICTSLDVDAVYGDLPALLEFRSGETLEHWSGLPAQEKPKDGDSFNAKSRPKKPGRITEKSWRTRFPLMNLRMEAELLIFMAQTQMNLAPAMALPNGKFSYQSFSGGYHVSGVFKERRAGESNFDIFSEYRVHFESYIKWRNRLFPEDGLLFPISSHFKRAPDAPYNFQAVKKIAKKLGIKSFTPRDIRLSKVNWLLRRTRDPQLTSEMAQHAETTLLRAYEQPNHQAALAEISRYHQQTDPALAAPGPVACIKMEPKALESSRKEISKPDCSNPAGCLFCVHQRDIAEFDHVWSLVSYRHLKSLELASHRPNDLTQKDHPAYLIVETVTEKLEGFKMYEQFLPWIAESLTRIDEGTYHPKWDGFVRLAEMRL